MAKREICGVELDEGSPWIIINTRDYHGRGRIPIPGGLDAERYVGTSDVSGPITSYQGI